MEHLRGSRFDARGVGQCWLECRLLYPNFDIDRIDDLHKLEVLVANDPDGYLRSSNGSLNGAMRLISALAAQSKVCTPSTMETMNVINVVLAQAAPSPAPEAAVPAPAGPDLSFFGSIANAGLAEQLVMILLVVFSVISWAIIAYKYTLIRRAYRESEEFLDTFGNLSVSMPCIKRVRPGGESHLTGLHGWLCRACQN